MTATLTRAKVYRSRWQEARMITDALRARTRYLKRRLQDPAVGDYDRTQYERRLRQTDVELAEARAKESAAWADIRAEELAAACNLAADRYKDHR